jgi:hypothetical protein
MGEKGGRFRRRAPQKEENPAAEEQKDQVVENGFF